jgi:tetrahydromethanopterin S-methyltransferase subunit B
MPGALEDGGPLEDRVATLEAQVRDLIRSRDATAQLTDKAPEPKEPK